MPESNPPARKRLPVKPSEEHLRKQAKRLARTRSISLSEAQHQLAREYGTKHWSELMHVVETMLRGSDQLSYAKHEMEALPKAANANDIARVREILASGEFTQHDLDLALARAVLRFRERAEIARLLLDHGADPDGQYGSDYGPIVFVTGECLDYDGLKFLVDAGCDVTFAPIATKYGMHCPLSLWLGTYLRGKNDEKRRGIDLLLTLGAHVPADVTPPVLAIHRDDAEALRAELQRDPGLAERTFDSLPYLDLQHLTLLHYACEFAAIACAGQLLKADASPRRHADRAVTPLHLAARNGPRALVELLIRHNGKTWLRDHENKDVLHYAREGVAPDKDAIVHLLDRPVIDDPHFRAAVNAIHACDLASLRRLLVEHPNLSRDRAVEPDCYPASDYFGSPKLLWFVAYNPDLSRPVPPTIVDLATAIIDAGVEQADLDYTLGLVMTSSQMIEQRHLRQMMELLIRRGANVTPESVHAALAHRLAEPCTILLALGQPLSAPMAAGLGRVDELGRLLHSADRETLRSALSLAVINDQLDAARLCLDAGADVNAFLVVHQHSTPAHQAAINDNVPMLELLIARGADPSIRDTLWRGTPRGWAQHSGKTRTEAYLRSIEAP
jgi:ankyrin repeat protein